MNKLFNLLKFPLSAALLGLVIQAALTSCSKATYSHLKWQAIPAVTDGKPLEWSIPLKFFDKDSKLNYDISNDKKNLYVVFKITDELTKMKVLNSGMQFAIDVKGKKTFPVSIGYPLSSEHNVQPGSDVPYTGEGNLGEETILAASKQMMRISGFNADVKEGLVPQKNEYGIQTAITITRDDILYYELRVPFKTFYKETITATDTVNPFSFEITLNPLTEGKMNPLDDAGDTNSQNGAGNGSGLPGGGGSMPGAGGGMPGGGGMPRHKTDVAPGNEKQVITQKLKLSIK